MPKPFIVAGGPVRNRAWIIGRHCQSLFLAMPSSLCDSRIFYLVNDCEDQTEGIIRDQLSWIYGANYDRIDTNEPGWHRGIRSTGWKGIPRYSMANLQLLRKEWIERALHYWPDLTHVWSVDSDILVSREVLNMLLWSKKDVISAPVATGKMTYNIMLGEDENGPRRNGTERDALLSTEEPFKVNLTGGCVLLGRNAIDRGVGWHSWDQRGEDYGLAASADAAGIDIYTHPMALGLTEHWMGEDEVYT